MTAKIGDFAYSVGGFRFSFTDDNIQQEVNRIFGGTNQKTVTVFKAKIVEVVQGKNFKYYKIDGNSKERVEFVVHR